MGDGPEVFVIKASEGVLSSLFTSGDVLVGLLLPLVEFRRFFRRERDCLSCGAGVLTFAPSVVMLSLLLLLLVFQPPNTPMRLTNRGVTMNNLEQNLTK